MKFRNQVLLLNLGILAGLCVEYFEGAPMLSLGLVGKTGDKKPGTKNRGQF